MWRPPNGRPPRHSASLTPLSLCRDPQRKKRLRELCSKQRWVEEAPVFLAFCVDMHRLELACQMHELHANLEHTETFLIAALDVGILLQNAAVAAEAFGLGMVMIGGLRNQPRQVAELLELPQGVVGVCGMCLGWPAKSPLRRPTFTPGGSTALGNLR